MTNQFDALNNLTSADEEKIEQQIREYFEETDMPQDEVEKRVALGIDLNKVFRNLFILMATAEIIDELENKRDTFADYAYSGYIDAMQENGYDVDPEGTGYIELYSKSRCKEIVDTAILHKADSFYGSLDHSILISEDESSAVVNYYDQLSAISSGMRNKTWVTMNDNRVRHSHTLLDGKTIGIYQPFTVGNYQMMFPCDRSLGASMKEIANCRCFIEYSK